MLIGGDSSYRIFRGGKRSKRRAQQFGWRVEFFGSEDPRKNAGQRHVSTRHYKKISDAILIGCSLAKAAIKKGAPK